MKPLPLLHVAVAFLLASCCVSSTKLQSSGSNKQPDWSTTPGLTTDFINSVAITANGDKVVGGTYYNTYETWQDPKLKWGTFGTYCYGQKGNLLWKDEFQGYVGVYWVDLSRDGAWAVSGGTFSDKPYQGFVRFHDANGGALLNHFQTSVRVNLVAMSDDGSTAVSAANTLRLFTRQGNSYAITDEFKPELDGDSIYTADISADGKRIVCGTVKTGTISVFDNINGKLVKLADWKLPSEAEADAAGTAYSHCIRITPSGKSFATGGSDGRFYLLDVDTLRQTGQPSLTYRSGEKGAIYSVAISDDANTIVGLANATNKTGVIHCVAREGSTGRKLWSRPLDRNPNRVQINKEQNLIAVADGHPLGTPGNFYLFDANTGTLRWQYTTQNMSWPIAISRDGQAIVGGSDDSKIYFFTPHPTD